jgi:hypothetical protein
MKSDKFFFAWVAAFLEGEGTFRKYSGGGQISISQGIDKKRTVVSTMKLLKLYFGGHLYYRKRDNLNYKQIIQWTLVKRKNVIYFLECILPYCLLRKKEIYSLLNYLIADDFKKPNILLYLPKVRMYLNKGYNYRKISKKLNYKISASTICRLKKEFINEKT